MDTRTLARELHGSRARGEPLSQPLSSRDPSFDLAAAYAVETELRQLRLGEGHRVIGRKLGYASRAVLRALKLQTVVFTALYDDTVVLTDRRAGTPAEVSLRGMIAARLEPEIVFCLSAALRTPEPGVPADASRILEHVAWIALGFEIVDCRYPDWTFKPVDFVADFGLHRTLVVGTQVPVTDENRASLAQHLATFSARLARADEPVAEGGANNVMGNPALALAELAAAIPGRPGEPPLLAGELVSTGTIVKPPPIRAGETWTVTMNGLELPSLSICFVA